MLERALVIEQYPKTDNMSTDAVGGLVSLKHSCML